MRQSTKGTLIALSVAALFSASAAAGETEPSPADKGEAKVKCWGVNQCAGKGMCAGPGNSCAGKNSCKGKGIMEMSAEKCAKQGGKAVPG